MKIIFFGTPSFAAALLEHLIKRAPQHQVVAVVSKPDKPKGRGQLLSMTPVHKVASNLLPHVPILQPVKVSSPEAIERLNSFQADLFVVVAYGEIVSKAVLALPKKGCINVHASLLPLLRGAAPIHRAIMEGFSETGITIMRMEAGLDSGDMILKKVIDIGENSTFDEVEHELVEVAEKALVEALDSIENKTACYIPQDHALATMAPKVTENDQLLDPHMPIERLHDVIRALTPRPGAYFRVMLRGKPSRLKVFFSQPVQCSEMANEVAFHEKDGELILRNKTGALLFKEVQAEGKAKMASKEFLRGCPVSCIALV